MSFRVLSALTAMVLLTVSVPVLVQQTAGADDEGEFRCRQS